jgi:RNA polymerase primary sigma factor
MVGNLSIFRSYSRDISKLKHGKNHYDLIIKAKSGDKEAINKIVENNIKLVIKIVSSYRLYGDTFVEAINVGCLGLMSAIQSYNFSKGTKFSTYASFWIKSSINNFLSQNHLINIPKSVKFGRDSSSVGICQNVVFLSDLPVNFDSNLPDTNSGVGSLDSLYYKELILEKISRLSPKEQFVIERRFGLNSKEEMSLREIGELFNTTPESIRYIEIRALKKLRSMLINEIY